MADKKGRVTVPETREIISEKYILSEFGGEQQVIVSGTFTDGVDSGYAPGSLGLDTNGKAFIADSAGLWQQLALVP